MIMINSRFYKTLIKTSPKLSNEQLNYKKYYKNVEENKIKEGNRFRCKDVLLEVVRIGAGGPASDAYKGEKVCSPMEPWFVFCQILKEGILEEGAEIKR